VVAGRHRAEAPDTYGDGVTFELPMLTRGIAVEEIYDDIVEISCRILGLPGA
jgi:hypothetical protein